MKPLRLLIDADFLVYRAGFGAEARTDVSPDQRVGVAVSYFQDAVDEIVYVVGERHKDRRVEYVGYLTPAGPTFRHRLAKTRAYKGQRDAAARPSCFRELRARLEAFPWIELASQTHEADDAIGLAATLPDADYDAIIVSVDKDLRNVPGRLYTPTGRGMTDISLQDARQHFLIQVLTGDRVDNVPSVGYLAITPTRVGPVTAGRLVLAASHEQAQRNVIETFQRAHGDGAAARLKESVQLLWILQHGRTWITDFPLIATFVGAV